MEKEKKDFAGWWLWVMLLIIVSSLVYISLSYCGLVGKTYVERKVFEQSYQKHEADKTAVTTYQAQLAVLHARLSNPDLTTHQKAEIKGQIAAVNILKAGKED